MLDIILSTFYIEYWIGYVTFNGFPPLLLVILSVIVLTSEQGWNPLHLTTTRPS